MLILLTGLPGTGKSSLANALASVMHADVLNRDTIRDAIFPAHDLDYSSAQNELASQVTYRVAEYILGRDPQRVLILDGRPFSRRVQVEEVVSLARRAGHPLQVIHCWAPDAVVEQRLEADLQNAKNLAAGRTSEKYWRIKDAFEPLEMQHLSLNTEESVEQLVNQVLAYLASHHAR